MEGIQLSPISVAIIGAGVSGVAAAVHLKRAGLEVTVYERSAKAGGIWYVDFGRHWRGRRLMRVKKGVPGAGRQACALSVYPAFRGRLARIRE